MKTNLLFFSNKVWKNITLFFFLIFNFYIVMAQDNLCENIPYDQTSNYNFGMVHASPNLSPNIIKVYFIVYRDQDDGTGGVNDDRLMDIMKRLNDEFNGTGFSFVWRKCETTYIKDPFLNNTTGFCNFNELHSDGLNLHIRGDGKAWGAIAKSIPGTVAILGGTHAVETNHTNSGITASASNMIVHEVGHCLGLFHTHHGSCSQDEDFSLCPLGSFSVPTPDGDMVDDTPLDPNLTRKMDINSCTWNGKKCDNNPTISITNPLTDNYMSYTRPTCMTSFTAGQIARMQAMCPANIKYYGPTDKPTLTVSNLSNQCPVSTIDLNLLVTSALPCGAQLKWSTDNDPSDGLNPIVSNIASQADSYYAYYYYADENNYGSASDPVNFLKINCCGEKEDLVINGNQEIIQNQDIGNIFVKTGAVLTIKSILQFAENKGIYVERGAKLIIEGGLLTKCPLVSSWNGIKVSGEFIYFSGFPITTVELKNGGSIENAKIAIDGLDNLDFFGINYDFGGAKISLSNSTISNCDIGIQFGPVYFDDQSNIDFSTFSNNNLAISMIQNKGCEIKNTTFGGNDLDIKANTSSFLADNNVFNGGIEMESLYPNFEGSTLINNEFVNIDESNVGIKIDAQSNATDFVIQNNIFYGVGILSMGELDFDITQNDFYDGPVGASISDSGLGIDNLIENNSFVNNVYGNSVYGINDIEFMTNCFESIDEYSIELYHGASVHLTQGNQINSAGNCFQTSIPIVTGDDTGYFDYYTKDPFIFLRSCKSPGTGNFGVVEANIESDQICGTSINIFGSIPPRYRDCNYYNFTDLKQMILTLRSEIKRIESATNISLWVKKWLISKHKRCLDRWIKLGSKDIMENMGKDSVITFLTAQPEFRYKSMAYGILIKYRAYADSRSLLNSLNISNDAENDFLITQNTYLDYIIDRKNFKLDEKGKSVLYQAGIKSNPLSGFSRTVYEKLFNDKIIIYFSHLNRIITPRAKVEEFSEGIKIFPNPVVKNELNVEIKNFDKTLIYVLDLYDSYGRLIESFKLMSSNEKYIIDSKLTGIHIVKISESKNTIYTKKIVIH